MPYEVTVAEDGRYVRVTVEGPMTVALAEEIFPRAIEAGASAGVTAYLYDLRASRNVESVLDNYEYANEPSAPFEHRNRIALLVATDDRSHDFVETVFRNAGYSVLIFRGDEPEAIRWLTN